MEKSNTYNAEILKRLITKYGVSKRFITMSLNGTRESETSEKIKSDYQTMEKEVNNLLNNL